MMRINTKQLIGSLLLTGLVLVGCSRSPDSGEPATVQSQQGLSPEQIQKSGVLRVAVFADNPPFGYIDAQGLNQGFDVAIAKRVAKDLLEDERKIQFVIAEAANRVEFLKSNKVDIVFASFSVTPERAEVVSFAQPYLKVALGIVSPKSHPITNVAQLDGKKLIVNKGSSSDLFFSKHYPKVQLLKFEQNTDAFNALQDGRGDAISQDSTYALAWAKQHPDFVAGISKIGNQDFIAPAVKKGNDALLTWLNTEMTQLKDTGEIQKIYDQTLKPVYGADFNAATFLDVTPEK